jgi:MEMO1 family protein
MSNLSVVFTPHPPIVIPEIGRGEEVKAKDTIEGMHKLGEFVQEMKPEVIIFITPHGNSFSNGTCILDKDIISGNFSNFGYPDIEFKKRSNRELSKKIYNKFEEEDYVSILMDDSLAKDYKTKVELDHGAMVPMYFIDLYYKEYEIVHITPGNTPLIENYYLGDYIQKAIEGEEKSVLLVCSGDLSHALKEEGPYKFHPKGEIFDEKVRNAILDKDPLSLISMENKLVQQAAQCGLRSFIMGFGFLDGIGYGSRVLSYEGPFGVGYLTGYLRSNDNIKNNSMIPKLGELSRGFYKEKTSKEDQYIKLARKAIEEYVKFGRKLDIDKYTREFTQGFIEEILNKKAGAFVSIHNQNMLRGCIGTIEPTQRNLLDEIIYNAINASGHDTRFHPIEEKELFDLDIKVDILKEPEPIDSIVQLDVKRYGVIVEKGHKRGLLLPNLEGVDSVEEQVEIAKTKANIGNQEKVKLYRFEVIRHEI